MASVARRGWAKAPDWGWDRADKGRGTQVGRVSTQNGADVDRKTRDVIARIPDEQVPAFRRGLSGAGAMLATTDGRWALVSTSLTALVAGAIAWMAVGMMPVSRPMVAPGRASLPYPLFMKLIGASEPQNVQNDNADNANPN